MSILNRPSDGLLSVLLSLRRALVAYGPQSESRLLELCAPRSVVSDGKPDMARKTLTRWTQLGFFCQVDGKIELAPAIGQTSDLDALRVAILRLVLNADNGSESETSSAEATDSDSSKAADFVRAVAWALSQDTYRFPATWGGVEKLQNEQGLQPPAFANDTRWHGFVEWSVFLGLAYTTTKSGITLNPSFAVQSVLPEVFVGTSELSNDLFFDRLASVLPIVDGGRYRLDIEGQIARPWLALQHHQLSTSLSTALLTLDTKRVITIQSRSDAKQKVLVGALGRELRSMSHIVFNGVPSC